MKFSRNVLVIISAMMATFPQEAISFSGCFYCYCSDCADGDYSDCPGDCWVQCTGGDDVVTGNPTPHCPGPDVNGNGNNRRLEVLDEQSQVGVMLKCGNVSYKVALVAMPGPHFLIGGFPADDKDLNCPPMGFASLDGKKVVMIDSADGFPTHIFGSSALIDIQNAHDKAALLDEAAYNFEERSCVHYAGNIWRELGFAETEQLASFLVDNIVHDPNLARMVKQKAGAFRTAAAFTLGPAEVKKEVEKMVHSQLKIQELPGGDLQLRVVQTAEMYPAE